jgi:hypothetical protein
MQRLLITLGIALLLVGVLWPYAQKLGLGKLPGDIVYRRDGFRFYFPLASSLIVSLLLTLLFWLFRR